MLIIMGVGRTFSRRWPIVDFSRGSQKFFQGGAKSEEISFLPLETKKTTFFAKDVIGKCKIS